ncbi:MAG TPA: PaaI family thioesterase [Thermoanaerobaculia bacterium]|nr:PaaI family thioesterase [Thermoanaerobaculia bacterium]
MPEAPVSSPRSPIFPPKNPRFREVVTESFSRQPLMSTLGAELVLVEPGEVHVALPYSAAFTQQNGFLHAGAVTSIADSACGYAAFTLAPPETDVLAVEFKINLMAPARAPRFLACATVLRPGRTLTVCEAKVYGILADGARELVASMLSTIITRAHPVLNPV